MTLIDFHSVLTLLFFVVFIGMVIWVFLPSRKKVYDNAAQLPFDGEPAQQEKRYHE